MSAMIHETAQSMTIGEVLSLLSPDFPEVSISKIRFLEAEGLISPRRAPSGYRRFSDDDVDQLRLVLTAQRDRYLPLKVIKDHLTAGTLKALVHPPAPHSRPEVEVDRPVVIVTEEPDDALDVDPREPLTRRELASRSGLSVGDVDELTQMGVVNADPAGKYAGADLLVCRAYATLRPYGVESRHLRQVKNSASRDAALIRSATGHLDDEERAAAVAGMVDAFSEAHYWQVVAELDRQGPATGSRRVHRRGTRA